MIFDSDIFDLDIFDSDEVTPVVTVHSSGRGSSIRKIPNLNSININIGHIEGVVQQKTYTLMNILPIKMQSYFLKMEHFMESININITRDK